MVFYQKERSTLPARSPYTVLIRVKARKVEVRVCSLFF